MLGSSEADLELRPFGHFRNHPELDPLKTMNRRAEEEGERWNVEGEGSVGFPKGVYKHFQPNDYSVEAMFVCELSM